MRVITVCPIEVVEGGGGSQCVSLKWQKEEGDHSVSH